MLRPERGVAATVCTAVLQRYVTYAISQPYERRYDERADTIIDNSKSSICPSLMADYVLYCTMHYAAASKVHSSSYIAKVTEILR